MTEIVVKSDACANMIDRIAQRAGDRRELSQAIGRAADDGARLITGVAHDTGELARSVQGRGWWIVATARNDAGAPYGRFVFGGTQHMAAQTPSVPVDAIARVLADEIKQAVFGR